MTEENRAGELWAMLFIAFFICFQIFAFTMATLIADFYRNMLWGIACFSGLEAWLFYRGMKHLDGLQ